MINSKRSNQSINPPLPKSIHQRILSSIQDKQDLFGFLQQPENKRPKSPSFFSNNGLSQDIIELTGAEPDICLEVFYALYHALWPQIEKQPDISFKDAWVKFIGSASFKGSLCPPEKLIAERRLRDIIDSLSSSEGERRIFHELDQAVNSIEKLKEKVDNYPGELLQKKEILSALSLAATFYKEYRKKIKALVQTIIEKEKINVGSRAESNELEDLLEPKAIMLGDIFSPHWAYRISRNRAQKLLSLKTNGHPIQNNLNDPSSHPVVALPENTENPLVYFKANGRMAIQPEKEFMLYSLYRHLQIPVPETALLILTDVFETNPDYLYAVQASEAVIGESALAACKNPETVFEEKAYASQAIGALLTNPSDGSFKNFKYCPRYKTLVSIDNDLVFKPELSGKGNKAIVNVKSILYLLQRIENPLEQSIVSFFTTLDPHLTILSWLQDLTKKNREYALLFTRLAFQRTRCIYQNLLPESETVALSACLQQEFFVDSKLHSDFFPQILMSKDLLNNMIEKLQIIEKTLLGGNSVNTQKIFEEISPLLAKYYRKLRQEFNDSEQALEAVWGHKKNGIDYSYIASLLSSEELSQYKNQQESKEKIPEKFFKEYKNLLLNSEESPLDRFIKRQNARKRRGFLNQQLALEELQLLIQEGLTNSLHPREIVDFCHSLSKAANNDYKEIISLLSNLPNTEVKWLLLLERHFLRADREVPKNLVSSSKAIFGAFLKQRTLILTESESRYLFDQQGNNLKKNPSLTGRSIVTCFPEGNPEFYLKQNPEWPGYEFASSLFMRLLGVTQLPNQDLLIFNAKYPVLLTQKVPGSPVLRVWENPEAFKQLDSFHTGLLIIAAMLINPEDGKEDNFILTPDGRFLIPIDNDHCFLPSFSQKEGSFWNAFTVHTDLQTKTILFCLNEMNKPIRLEVKQHIISLNFDLLLTKWLTELDKLENRFNNLVDQSQRDRFLKQNTVMSIPFYKQFIHNIHWKAHKIQDILRSTEDPTPFDLLKAVEPFAARCYFDSFSQGTSLQSRFKAATNKLYTKTEKDGSRVSILNTRTMMEIISISEKELQKDPMYQKKGPLDSLELLKELIEEQKKRAKIEKDLLCELNDQNKEGIFAIIFGNPVVETALKEFLASQKEGLLLKGSKLITSSKLKELFKQAPNQGMKIRFLSLPDSPLLGYKEIRLLAEGCPNLEYLNVSGCGGLFEIETMKKEWPLLTRLEAKECLNLGRFVSFSPIKILRIETSLPIKMHFEKLAFDTLMISIPRLGFYFSLTKGEEFELKKLEKTISNSNFLRNEEEQIKRNIEMLYITTEEQAISSISDLSVFITVIDLRDFNLKPEDIQRMKALNLVNLKRLDLSRNQLKGTDYLEHLIEGNWPKLGHLNLADNEIHDEGCEILAKGKWPLLEVLNLQETKITSAGLETIVKNAQWEKLKNLDISENEINDEGLVVLCQGREFPLFETLNLGNMGVTKRVLLKLLLSQNWPNLKEIRTNGPRKDFAISLLPKNWWNLEKLDLSYEDITQEEIRIMVEKAEWPQLKHLDLFGNELTSEALEVLCKGNWPQLETLNLDNRYVSKKAWLKFLLRITNWPLLKEINFGQKKCDFSNNLLTRNWPYLEELDLSYSKITESEIEMIVDWAKWPRLKSLNLSGNELDDAAIEVLCKGNWPLLETLNLEKTCITANALVRFLLKENWPKLVSIKPPQHWKNSEAALIESFLREELSKEELIRSLAGKEIINDKIDPPELVVNSLEKLQGSNGKRLDFSNRSFAEVEGLSMEKCSEVEDLCLSRTSGALELLSQKSDWPNLKKLDISCNIIPYEGLGILFSIKWVLLEDLNLAKMKINAERIKILVSKSDWPNLKKLDLSWNPIQNEGLAKLCRGKWPKLEELCLQNISVTGKGIEIMASNSDWPSLKVLDLSVNKNLFDEELKSLGLGKWPILEFLSLKWTNIALRDVEILVDRASWGNLKELHFRGLAKREEVEPMKALILEKWPEVKTDEVKRS